MRHFRFAVRAAALIAAIVAGVLLSESGAFAQVCITTGANSASGSGLVGGAQAGYNWQQGAMVFGLETDLSGSALESSMSRGLSGACAGTSADTTAKVDWYGTLRARAGFAAGKALFYGTGGLAYGHVDLDSNFTALGLSLHTDDSSVRTGWVAGGGIDYMLEPNVIVNLGYQYVDLGSTSLYATTSGAGVFATQTAHTHAAFNVVTLGLSWRFAPGPAPWSGGYVGAHAGGDWGLDSNATYNSGPTISDRRLKRDVALVAVLDNGLGLYRFRYLWSDTVHVGVMAQEVALIRPDAVVRDPVDDYLRVDYRRLGLHMMTWPEWRELSTGAAL
jgi:outer membrane immunogenic protein